MTSIASLLFPQDVLEPNKVDEHFRPEANAARSLGIDVHLVDHDAILAGDIDQAITRLSTDSGPLLYRGWMMPPHRYAALAKSLEAKSIQLQTTADEFQRNHQLPGWYQSISQLTAESVWTTGNDLEEFEQALSQLGSGAAVLKDYSKSEKHYWDEAMYIPDVTDRTHARQVAARFVELRGGAFDAGFVLRRFEDYSPGEYRTWWVEGELVLVTAHPDTPDDIPENLDVATLSEPIRAIGAHFITADIATLAQTGEARIVEIGDGQVSDRPTTTNPEQFIQAIVRA